MKLYLYEGLNAQDRASVMLWESAGRKLVEAQLTADQITQLFQQIQTAKNNRTLVGKGVDAGSAVMKAYNDLKTKISTSGPIKNMDALYDQAAEKLKQATGGDQGAMQYVQKYRDFAKKHPIAQSFIYGALIAAAGISGAGAGGAAALGLFKMVDKLLQGEKFSSAAYSGAKTGAMAYAAGQIGKAVRGDQGATGAEGALSGDRVADGAYKIFADKVARGEVTDYNSYVRAMNDAVKQAGGDKLKALAADSAHDQLEMMIQQKTIGGLGGEFSGSGPEFAGEVIKAFGGTPGPELANQIAAVEKIRSGMNESRNLSRKQVLALFERVARLNSRMLNEGRLEEGIWDDIKSGAGKGLQGIKSLAGKAAGAVAQGAAKVGRSMTAKVSSDALTKAWEKAGKPTDSVEIEKLLQAQGVNPEVISTVFKANNIPVSTPTTASPMPDVMSSNRAETPAPAGPTASPVDQGQATQTSAEPTASSASQGAIAQGVQQAQQPQISQQPQQTQQPQQAQGGQQQQQPSATASKLPDVTRLTPEQKKQLLAQIDKQLASMPAPTVQQPTAPAPQPPAAPAATAPTQSATANKMSASTTPAATTQQAIDAKMQPGPAQQAVAANMPATVKTAKPKVPYSAIAQKAQPAKVSAPRNPGAPTDAEYDKFQGLLKQAMAKQGA
jgi:hypothetical protein